MKDCYMHPYYIADTPMGGWWLTSRRLAGYLRGAALWAGTIV